jgi:hypothetical protein
LKTTLIFTSITAAIILSLTKILCACNHDIRLWLDTFILKQTIVFLLHDYKVAKIIANDLIQVYLEDRLNNINVKRGSDNSLKWTASKTALTELYMHCTPTVYLTMGIQT